MRFNEASEYVAKCCNDDCNRSIRQKGMKNIWSAGPPSFQTLKGKTALLSRIPLSIQTSGKKACFSKQSTLRNRKPQGLNFDKGLKFASLTEIQSFCEKSCTVDTVPFIMAVRNFGKDTCAFITQTTSAVKKTGYLLSHLHWDLIRWTKKWQEPNRFHC